MLAIGVTVTSPVQAAPVSSAAAKVSALPANVFQFRSQSGAFKALTANGMSFVTLANFTPNQPVPLEQQWQVSKLAGTDSFRIVSLKVSADTFPKLACLDAINLGASVTNPALLIVSTCDGRPSQRWRIASDAPQFPAFKQITNTATGLVINPIPPFDIIRTGPRATDLNGILRQSWFLQN